MASAMIAPSVANAVSRIVPNALPSAAANPLSDLCVKVEAVATMAVITAMARTIEKVTTAVSAPTALIVLIVPSARLSVVKLLLLPQIQHLLLLRLHPRQKLQQSVSLVPTAPSVSSLLKVSPVKSVVSAPRSVALVPSKLLQMSLLVQ